MRQPDKHGTYLASSNVLDALTMDNQIAIVKSTALLRRVVEKERLVDDPEFRSRSFQGGTPSEPRKLIFRPCIGP